MTGAPPGGGRWSFSRASPTKKSAAHCIARSASGVWSKYVSSRSNSFASACHCAAYTRARAGATLSIVETNGRPSASAFVDVATKPAGATRLSLVQDEFVKYVGLDAGIRFRFRDNVGWVLHPNRTLWWVPRFGGAVERTDGVEQVAFGAHQAWVIRDGAVLSLDPETRTFLGPADAACRVEGSVQIAPILRLYPFRPAGDCPGRRIRPPAIQGAVALRVARSAEDPDQETVVVVTRTPEVVIFRT